MGLLGPNGAGKTTTVSMIAGLLDAGSRRRARRRRGASAGDTDPTKRRIGLVPQDLALYDELSARAPTCASSARSTACPARRSTAAITSALDLVGLADRAARSRQDVQRRHETAAESCRRSAARSRHPAARRADRRRRSAEPQRHLREPRNAESAAARRCSTRPTTWRRPSGSPIASSSSITAR